MDGSLILSIISIATTSIVGIILYKQINSQKELIEHYKTYIETLDINKFKSYIDTVDELNEKKLIAETEKMQIDKEKSIKKFASQATELTMLISYFMNTNTEVSKEEKLEFIKHALPLTYKTVSLVIK